MDKIERDRGCLLGLAIGDALGTTLEFQPPPFNRLPRRKTRQREKLTIANCQLRI
jgi:hypothetical protein